MKAIAAQAGIGFRIADFGGNRTKAQTALIKEYRANDFAKDVARGAVARDTTLQRYRPISEWGHSMHNYGSAFDVVVETVPPGMSRLAALNFLKDQSDAIGLVDGRDFPNPDAPHFELQGGLSAARAAWMKLSGSNFFRG